jgi:NAD(P)-dependent dehydrogenase (short-subunit alcohol dehydrogenase family)
LMKNTPAKRWGKPEEIGKIAAFICSPAANFMTGNDILSDGGWVAQ